MTTLSHQKAANISFLVGAVTLITLPDLVFGLLSELMHFIVEIAHLAFELLEIFLDHLIEHLFETEVHETQVIVFYLIVAMGATVGYFMLRSLSRLMQKAKANTIALYKENKTQAQLYWHSQSIIKKTELLAIATTGLTLLLMFGF